MSVDCAFDLPLCHSQGQLFDDFDDAFVVPSERPRLLVAVADDALAETCQGFFTARGFATETAWCGLKCLETLRAWRPHVLLLDLELPWSGVDAILNRLREELDGDGLPILLVVGETPNDPDSPIFPPIVACFPRPVALHEILATLQVELSDWNQILAAARPR